MRVSKARQRELDAYALENALAHTRRQYEMSRPVVVAGRWVHAADMRAMYELARFSATTWARVPVPLQVDGSAPEARMQAATGAQEIVRAASVEQPWHEHLAIVLRDAGATGAPRGVERRAMPWQAVSALALAGRMPIASVRIVEPAAGGRAGRVEVCRFAIEAASVGQGEAITRRDGEHRAAQLAIEHKRLVAVVRRPDGRALVVRLRDHGIGDGSASSPCTSGAILTAPPPARDVLGLLDVPTTSDHAHAVRAQWRAALDGVETIAAPDGLVSFPTAGADSRALLI